MVPCSEGERKTFQLHWQRNTDLLQRLLDHAIHKYFCVYANSELESLFLLYKINCYRFKNFSF